MSKKKLSQILDEQVKKTEAILGYIEKHPVKSAPAYMYLTMALNSLRVVKNEIVKSEGGEEFTKIDQQAAFMQMKDFFSNIEDVLKRTG